jgi:hypothetical protein
MAILFASCSKDENDSNPSSNSDGDGDDTVVAGIFATADGDGITAQYHCPDGDGLEDCNVRNESTGLVRMEMTVSDEDQKGWSIEFFIDDLENATFPLEIEEMTGGPDDIPLNFSYYDGSWTGENQYRYQNMPGSDGELSFTITNFDGSIIEGEFSGEIQKLSNPNETVIFENGEFNLELNYQ